MNGRPRGVSRVMAALLVLSVVCASVTTAAAKPAREPEAWPTTAAVSGVNLNGKMVTLSLNSGGISFYPPHFFPYDATQTSSPAYSTSAYPTQTSSPAYSTSAYPTYTYPPWTTGPPTRGVSVCLRYLADYLQSSKPTIFTLSPSSDALKLTGSVSGVYSLSLDRYGYYNLYLSPKVKFWKNIGPDIWTRVCLTVDSMKNVVQVFSGSSMSIRKRMPIRYAWSGEPVIDFSGFDGQMTDLQVWDYPLHYRDIFNYMSSGVLGLYRGSVLTWSGITYSVRGDVLLEDVFERQAKEPISIETKMHRPMGEKKTKKFFGKRRVEAGKKLWF